MRLQLLLFFANRELRYSHAGEVSRPILILMVAHTLRLNRPELQGIGVKAGVKVVNKVVRRAFNRSQVLCPVDTGNLRASGRMNLARVGGALVVGSIEYTARYAAAVHEGRRALTIRARGNGRLRFVVDGRVVYARQVHQPARPGRPFLVTALREVAAAEGFDVRLT